MTITEHIRRHIASGGPPPVLSTGDCLEVLDGIAADSPVAEAMSPEERCGLNLVINTLSRRGLG
jgi:hypothetical protein